MQTGATPILFDTTLRGGVTVVDVSPAGDVLLVGQQGDDNAGLALGLWTLDGGSLDTALISGKGVFPLAGCFSPDGRLVAYSDGEQRLALYDRLRRSTAGVARPDVRFTKWISFAQHSNRLIVGGTRTVVWDVEREHVLFTLPTEPLPETRAITPPACALSPDGNTVAASGVESGWILVYDVHTGTVVKRVASAITHARSMAFDSTGRYLAAVARKGGAGLWDLLTDQPILPELLNTRSDYYWQVRFRPNSMSVGLGLWSGFVELVRFPDGQFELNQATPFHARRVNAISFTADGTRMFTGGDDGCVLIWALS